MEDAVTVELRLVVKHPFFLVSLHTDIITHASTEASLRSMLFHLSALSVVVAVACRELQHVRPADNSCLLLSFTHRTLHRSLSAYHSWCEAFELYAARFVLILRPSCCGHVIIQFRSRGEHGWRQRKQIGA